MKKHLLVATALLAFTCSFLPGCIKDSYKKSYTYTYYEPVYKTTQEVRDNIKSNAARPIENPGKLYVLGNYIFLNDIDKGIHVIDNSNPAQPRNIAFIDIPGNLDIAIKGNTLYADMYTDLVTIDISDPHAVSVKKFINNLYPYRAYGNGYVNPNDPQKIVVDWVRHDTTVKNACNQRLTFMSGRADVFFAQSAVNTG